LKGLQAGIRIKSTLVQSHLIEADWRWRGSTLFQKAIAKVSDNSAVFSKINYMYRSSPLPDAVSKLQSAEMGSFTAMEAE
jgi:hypothetical protein